MQSSHGFRKTTHFCVVFCCPETPWTKNPTAWIRGPRGILCTRGEKEQTSKRQTNDVYGNCLVKSAVCDVALCSVETR